MTIHLSVSESKFFEASRTALGNAESNLDIKTALADCGIDQAKIADGWKIYNNAKAVWEQNHIENTKTRIASNAYHTFYEMLRLKFRRHRELTLILCNKNQNILIQLGVKGRFPKKYNEFFDKLKLFYTEAKNNEAIRAKLAIIKLTPEVATDCLNELDHLLKLRADFDMEMGESQVQTERKNNALLELKEWMDNFHTILKVALYDHPQRMEILGIQV